MRRYRLFWTPTLYFLDMSGNAHAESVGFLPPDEMLPLLDYGDAQVALRRGRFQQAADRLVGLAQTYPDSGFAPDALYWAAIAEYMTTGDNARLNERRAELERRFPGSLAAKKV